MKAQTSPATRAEEYCKSQDNPFHYSRVTGFQEQAVASNTDQRLMRVGRHPSSSLSPTFSPSEIGGGNVFCTNWVGTPRYSEKSDLQNITRSSETQKKIEKKYQGKFANQKLEARPTIREEMVALGKLKVAARHKKKTREGQNQEGFNVSVQAAKLDFSLEQTSEEFPVLTSLKQARKPYKYTGLEGAIEGNGQTCEGGKSWKPKKKDPILINIGTALQKASSLEKSKLLPKKTEVSIQPHIQVGNHLDSNKPQRKKGKVRPDKPKKPSKLKEHILSERKSRLEQTNVEDLKDDCIYIASTMSGVEEASCSAKNELTELLAGCSVGNDQNCGTSITNADYQSKPANNVFSRRFREYCTNCLTHDLVTNVCSLLERLAQFQDRTFAQNPIKADAKRRYVAGLHQTNRYLQVKKVKLLVIAPDLEKISGEGGLDEKINKFKTEAECQSVPCVFGPNRNRLGKAVFKKAMVSCVAVLNYEGAEEQFFKVMEALQDAKNKYLMLTRSTPTPHDDNSNSEEGQIKLDATAHSLLNKLKQELTPADKLLKAITIR